MTTSFMGEILGIVGILFYIAAPFRSDAKKALYMRLIAEVLLAMMFLYHYDLAGVSYYGFLVLSAAFEKKIETSRIFSLIYGIIAAGVTLVLNGNGIPGIFLAASLILLFLHLDEKRQLTFTSYTEVLTSLILMWYSLSVRVWAGFAFGILLLVIAAAGMVSSIQLARHGGYDAAAREEAAYQAAHPEKPENTNSSTDSKAGRTSGSRKK